MNCDPLESALCGGAMEDVTQINSIEGLLETDLTRDKEVRFTLQRLRPYCLDKNNLNFDSEVSNLYKADEKSEDLGPTVSEQFFEDVPDEELYSWPSDSEITMLRVKNECKRDMNEKFENHLNLAYDDSKTNYDIESDSMINLADVVRETGQSEGLAPFSVWSKPRDTHFLNPVQTNAEPLMKQELHSVTISPGAEPHLTTEKQHSNEAVDIKSLKHQDEVLPPLSAKEKDKEKRSDFLSRLGKFIHSIFGCTAKKNVCPQE